MFTEDVDTSPVIPETGVLQGTLLVPWKGTQRVAVIFPPLQDVGQSVRIIIQGGEHNGGLEGGCGDSIGLRIVRLINNYLFPGDAEFLKDFLDEIILSVVDGNVKKFFIFFL